MLIYDGRYEGHSTITNNNTREVAYVCLLDLTLFPHLCLTGVDNFYDGVEDMIGYRPNPWMKWSWTIITPVLCMVRDHWQPLRALHFIGLGSWICDMLIRSRSVGGVQLASTKRSMCLFFRAALSSPWWSTSPWPITRCTSTLTGLSVWAGVWPCPPWSASPWWWSSRSYSLRDPWSRWDDSTL